MTASKGLPKLLRIISILTLFLTVAQVAAAQRVRPKPVPTPPVETTREKQNELTEAASQSRAKLISATKEYQASLEKLLALLKDEEERAAALVAKRRVLLQDGIIAKRELEESERALAEVRSKAENTRKGIGEAEQLVTEVVAAEQLAQLPPEEPANPYPSNVILIRYTGTANWALGDVVKVDAFFRTTFGRSLPVSALGQTATHNQLGFNHRESVDVALHPDSAEGRALMDYLRAQGIPFLAFRGPVAGSATGAHIHIGRPSHRISN